MPENVINAIPKTEKKSINAADIWITLLLPTRVNPKRPAFSLFESTYNIIRFYLYLLY